MKFLFKIFLFLSLVLTITIILIFICLKTNTGNKVFSCLVTRYIKTKSDTNYKIDFENLVVSFPFTIKVNNIAFSDEKGIFCNFEEVHINMLPSSTLFWKIAIQKFSAQRANLLRLPHNHKKSSNNLEEEKKKQKLLLRISIQDTTIHKIVLSPELTGFIDDINFSLKGFVDIDLKGNDITFNAKIKTTLVNQSLVNKKLTFIDYIIFEITGDFNLIKSIMVIKNLKLSSPYFNFAGILNIHFLSNILTGTINYSSTIIQYLFPKYEFLKTLCTGKISFSEKISAPRIVIDGHISTFNESQNFFQLPKLDWKIDLSYRKEELNGDISLNSGGIEAYGKIQRIGSKFYLKNFIASNGKDVIGTASFFSDNQMNIANGVLNIHSKNIYDFKEFFPFLEKGCLDIKTIYNQDLSGDQKLNISGSLKHTSTFFAASDFIGFDVFIRNSETFKLEHANLTMHSLVSKYINLKRFYLNAKETDGVINFLSQIVSMEPYLVDLKINSKLFIQDLKKDLAIHNVNYTLINNVSGTFNKIKIMTIKPIIVVSNKLFYIIAPYIKANNGKLNLYLALDDLHVTSHIIIEDFFAGIISMLLPPSFRSSLISGNIDLNGHIYDPVFRSILKVTNTQLLDKKNTTAFLKLSSYIRNSEASIDATILQKDQVLGNLRLQVPYKFSLSPFTFSLLENNNINADLELNEGINMLSLIPMSGDHRLKGYLTGNVNITGSLRSPSINGTLFIFNAEYEYPIYGIKLKNISSKIISKGEKISIVNFIAEDIYSNVLEGQGDLSLRNNILFRFCVNTKKFNIVNTPYLRGEVGGRLVFSGDSKKALATGVFDLGPMEIKIPENFADNIPIINIVKAINHDKIVYPIQDKPYILNLNLDLNTKNQVYVRGRGVNTLLSGNLKITNNVFNPYIFGKLRSVRGRYQEFGKLFTVKEGVLTFNGPISPSPYLNIVGVLMSGNTEINLILAGSIFNPNLIINSTPSLNQQESLSLLLFGKNQDSISTIQALGLASGMRKLSNSRKDFDPLGIGRKILGVDDISIKNDDNIESLYIRVGKHITDKVYIEIDQGNQAFGINSKIDIELTPKIFIEAISAKKKTSSFGMNWKLDY